MKRNFRVGKFCNSYYRTEINNKKKDRGGFCFLDRSEETLIFFVNFSFYFFNYLNFIISCLRYHLNILILHLLSPHALVFIVI